ncbi:SocA family protein [Vibrio vulnificus]
MNKIQKIIAYFCVKYPHKGELSKARLTKLVYLADWFSALIDDRQLTDIDWLFNHYGPYVDDVVEVASRSPDFSIVSEQTMYGSDKYLISFNGYFDEDSLPYRERQILDFVIDKTKNLYFNDFIDYVYSTYPVESRNRYSRLDLVSLAREYNALTNN